MTTDNSVWKEDISNQIYFVSCLDASSWPINEFRYHKRKIVLVFVPFIYKSYELVGIF